MHEHDWKPVPNECGQYACECGLTGRRHFDGTIVPHKKPKSFTSRTVNYGAGFSGYVTPATSEFVGSTGFRRAKLPGAE